MFAVGRNQLERDQLTLEFARLVKQTIKSSVELSFRIRHLSEERNMTPR